MIAQALPPPPTLSVSRSRSPCFLVCTLSLSLCLSHTHTNTHSVERVSVQSYVRKIRDEKEDTVLGSLPLLSFQIGGVEPSDNITRKFAFKVRLEKEEGEDVDLKGPVVFCMQAEHAGTRTYYFSADSHEEQEEWIRAMSEAAEVHNEPTKRVTCDTTVDLNHTMVTKAPNPQTQQHPHTQTHSDPDSELPPYPKSNGVNSLEKAPASAPCRNQEGKMTDGRRREGEDEGGGPPSDHTAHTSHHPNGLGNYGHHNTMTHNSNSKPPSSRSHSKHRVPQGHPEGGVSPSHNPKEQQDNVVLRRGFVPRTAPERVAQRKSSMAQLQQWVNQRRGMASQEDINSPSHYYPVNRGVSGDYYGYPGGPQYVEEYSLYPPGVRPDSICSVSAVGGYNRRWTVEEKRHSLRDRPHQLYKPPVPRDHWCAPYCGGMETSMRRLSIQPRSRSVPRSPSSSSGGPYSPLPPNFVSPARSPSACFDRFPGRRRDEVIYADPSVYSLRRSLSSPKEDILDLQLQRNLDYLDQQVPPFHDVYRGELHPTLKLNEIETSKLLGRLCEQNQILKDHEAVVHRLRMDKDSLEEALVGTHQEMELYQNQSLAMEKLQFKKETLQNQLINIRGELSQASSALTTTRMEFEALEDEANAIHGDLWEQLNAGGQSELVRRHIQKEFWRVQDVLEGLHKNNSSKGTDTAKHRVASGASGSFSTNSPASPLSSVSLTSPISPFSPVPGSQASPTKQLGPEVPPFHDVYRGELHPTLKLNEIETSKLLGRLCEQNQILKDHEAVVHRLRMDKDSLEEALVGTHQEMELYQNQSLAMEKLQFKKETLQNQLINIRGELSQASSALTTTRMEFEALEDEANAIHGDLWEQLNAGGQSELVRRHIQKEFWRVQDVLEGLHKNNSSKGTDTAKHRVASGASGSFSTNSPASPLSSVSLTSPISPFSPVPGSQASPTKQLGPEPKFGEQNNISDVQDQVQDRQSTMNKVGIVPPRTKSPTGESQNSSTGVSRHDGRVSNGISRERPKSAVFPAEVKSKMSVEEQNERIRRNKSSSVRDKRRSLNLSGGQSPANYKVIRRRLTAHEIDIKDLEAAVRGQGQESPSQEIARLRRSKAEPYDLDINKELLTPDKVVISERYLDVEDNTPLSLEEQKEKQKKLERIKTLIAKSNLQNMVPLLDSPVEGGAPVSSQQQLQEQEKRIEISCALAAEASRRSRLLSAQCAPSPHTSPTSLAPPPSSADFPNSTHIMKA